MNTHPPQGGSSSAFARQASKHRATVAAWETVSAPVHGMLASSTAPHTVGVAGGGGDGGGEVHSVRHMTMVAQQLLPWLGSVAAQ